MKNTRRWPPFLMAAAFVILAFGSCEEWGQMDPPAGTDVTPRLETVGTFDFEEGIDPQVIQTFAYDGGDTPDLVSDADLGSQVLHLDGGYARIFNPMLASSAQEAVSLTFWVKQAALDEDAVAEGTAEKDLESALIAFENENATQSMYITGNGALVYEGANGSYSANTTDVATTGLLDEPGEWHYVAAIVHNEGYTIYVDGNRRINETSVNFDFSNIVQFMAKTSYVYVGYGAEQNGEWWIDDLTFYRNTINSTQIARPGISDGGVDYNTYQTVGSTDCTTGWWSAFSNFYTFKESLHFGFYNYNNGTTNNWCNWLIVLTNGRDRGEEGYAEYFVLRSDAYGWGTHYNGDNISHNFNWDTFCAEMDGAYVDLTLTRTGNIVSMKAVVTSSSGATYNYTYSFEGEYVETLGAFLTCEGSYLNINVEETYTEGQSFPSGSYRVGPEDCSGGWWTYFSENYVIEGDTEAPFGFVFYNYNNGTVNNWCNWLLVATNGPALGEAGYAEYFVLRSDAYGWGSVYNGDNISHSFNWDTFCADMDGAYVRVFVTRTGGTLRMRAKIRTAAGVTLGDYTFFVDGITTDQVGLFLTAEGSSLDILKVGYFPDADEIQN